MANKSSIMARAVKNIFNEKGTDFPTIAKMPKEKAISVAVGIAQPFSKPLPRVMMEKMIAGKATPHKAAIAGKRALLSEESSPTIVSRLISIPT